MKTLFLHIGMHKTGTSSLQMTLFKNRDTLAQHGITYLDIEDNHSAAFFSLFSNDPTRYHINQKRGIQSAAEVKAHNEYLHSVLKAKLDEIDTPFTIISGEDLSLLPKAKVPELKAFLTPFFDRIHVIGYARAPVSFINSMAQQALKGGAILDDLATNPPKPAYQWRFQKYLDTFSADNVTLRHFNRSSLKDGCIVADFLYAAGLPDFLRDNLTLFNNNTSLSMTAALLLDQINQRIPVMLPEGPNTDRHPKTAATLAQLDGPPFTLNPDEINAALADSDWDIKWMANQLGINTFDDRNQLNTTMAAREIEWDKVATLVHNLLPK